MSDQRSPLVSDPGPTSGTPQVTNRERALRQTGADHHYVPLLMTTPGVGWVLGYTIAAEIGDIERFPSPTKLAGYTGLCPRVYQSGGKDHRGPLAKNGPKYLPAAEHLRSAAGPPRLIGRDEPLARLQTAVGCSHRYL